MAADNNEYVNFLFTDMSKAFDSLHPALTIQKLKSYSFSGASQNLIRFFLERRRNFLTLCRYILMRKQCPQLVFFKLNTIETLRKTFIHSFKCITKENCQNVALTSSLSKPASFLLLELCRQCWT